MDSAKDERQTDGRSRAEAVQGAALALERVDDVERGDGLALGVLSVGDRVADDVLEEAAASARRRERGDGHLQHAARLLVDETRDTLDTAATSQTPDRGLGDALHGQRACRRRCERTWMLSRKLGESARDQTKTTTHILRWRFAPPLPRPCVGQRARCESDDAPCRPAMSAKHTSEGRAHLSASRHL